jgi:peroxiredoxin
MVLTVGKPALDACLESHLGSTIRLSDFRGKCNLVLAFFPLAWTPI